jgi:hypothetical protein
VQANGALTPEANKSLQESANQREQKNDELRRIEITRAVFPDDK